MVNKKGSIGKFTLLYCLYEWFTITNENEMKWTKKNAFKNTFSEILRIRIEIICDLK